MSSEITISLQFVDLEGKTLAKVPSKREEATTPGQQQQQQLPQFHIRYDLVSENGGTLLSTLTETAKRALRLHGVSEHLIVVRAFLAGSFVELPSHAVAHRVVLSLHEELYSRSAGSNGNAVPPVSLQIHVDWIPDDAAFRAIIFCCGYAERVEVTSATLNSMLESAESNSSSTLPTLGRDPVLVLEQQQLNSMRRLFEFVRAPFQYAELEEAIDPEHFFIITTNSNSRSNRENFAAPSSSPSSLTQVAGGAGAGSNDSSSGCLPYTRISNAAALVRYLSSPLVVSSHCTVMIFCIRNTDEAASTWKSAKAASVALDVMAVNSGSSPLSPSQSVLTPSFENSSGPRQFLRLQTALRHELDCLSSSSSSSARMLVDFAKEFHEMEYVASSFQRVAWAVATLLGAGNIPSAPVVDRVRITRDNPWRWLLKWCESEQRAEVFLQTLRCVRLSFIGAERLEAVAKIIFHQVVDPRQLMAASMVLSALCSWCQSLVRASLWARPEGDLPSSTPAPRPPTPKLLNSRPSSSASSAAARRGSKLSNESSKKPSEAYAFFYSQHQQRHNQQQQQGAADAAALRPHPPPPFAPPRRFNNGNILPAAPPPASSNIFFLANKDAKSPLSMRRHSLGLDSPFASRIPSSSSRGSSRQTQQRGEQEQQQQQKPTKSLKELLMEYEEMTLGVSTSASPRPARDGDTTGREQSHERDDDAAGKLHDDGEDLAPPLAPSAPPQFDISIVSPQDAEPTTTAAAAAASASNNRGHTGLTLEQQRARSPAPPSMLHSSMTQHHQHGKRSSLSSFHPKSQAQNNSNNNNQLGTRRAQRQRNERRRSMVLMESAQDFGQVDTPTQQYHEPGQQQYTPPDVDLANVALAMEMEAAPALSEEDRARRSQLLSQMRNFDFGEQEEQRRQQQQQQSTLDGEEDRTEDELKSSFNSSTGQQQRHHHQQMRRTASGRDLTVSIDDSNSLRSTPAGGTTTTKIERVHSFIEGDEPASATSTSSAGRGFGSSLSTTVPRTKKRNEIGKSMSDLAAGAELSQERFVSIRFLRISTNNKNGAAVAAAAAASSLSNSSSDNKKLFAAAALPAHIRVLESNSNKTLLCNLYPEGDPDHEEGVFITRATVDRSKALEAKMLRERGLRSGAVPVVLELVVDKDDGSTVRRSVQVQPSKLSGGPMTLTFKAPQKQGGGGGGEPEIAAATATANDEEEGQEEYHCEVEIAELCPCVFDTAVLDDEDDRSSSLSQSRGTPAEGGGGSTGLNPLLRAQSAFGVIGRSVSFAARRSSEVLVRVVKVCAVTAAAGAGAAESEEGIQQLELPPCSVAVINAATGSEICRTNVVSSSAASDSSSCFFNPVFVTIDVLQAPSGLALELWAEDENVQPLARGSLAWDQAALNAVVPLVRSSLPSGSGSSSSNSSMGALQLALSVAGFTPINLQTVRGTWCVCNIVSGVELLAATLPPPPGSFSSYAELARFYKDAVLNLEVFATAAASSDVGGGGADVQQQEPAALQFCMQISALDFLSNGFEGLDQTFALQKPEQLLIHVSCTNRSISSSSSSRTDTKTLRGLLALDTGLYSKTLTVELFSEPDHHHQQRQRRNSVDAVPAALLKLNCETATTRSHNHKEEQTEQQQQQQQQEEHHVRQQLEPTYTLLVFQAWRSLDFPSVQCFVRTGKHRLLSNTPLELQDHDILAVDGEGDTAAAATTARGEHKNFVIPTRLICDDWLALDFFDRESSVFVGRVAVPLQDDSDDAAAAEAAAAAGHDDHHRQQQSSGSLRHQHHHGTNSSHRIRTLQLEVFSPGGAVENTSLMLSLASLSVDPSLVAANESTADEFALQVRKEAGQRFLRHLDRFEHSFSSSFSLTRPAWSSASDAETSLDEFVRVFFASKTASRGSDPSSSSEALQHALRRSVTEDVAFPVIDTDFKHESFTDASLLHDAKKKSKHQQAIILCKPRNLLSGTALLSRTFVTATNSSDAAGEDEEFLPSRIFINTAVRRDPGVLSALALLGETATSCCLSRCLVQDSNRLWKAFNAFGVFLRPFYDGGGDGSRLVECVPLDDWVPAAIVRRRLMPLVAIGQSTEAPLLWPLALHKAMAKFFGTFEVLRDLDLAEAMELLTGAPQVHIPLLLMDEESVVSGGGGFFGGGGGGEEQEEERQQERDDMIAERLQGALDAGAICCFETFAVDDADGTIQQRMGLEPGTAYAVLDVQVVDYEDERGNELTANMVLLRDPCRRVSRYGGKFRRESPFWKRLQALRSACLCMHGDDDDDEDDDEDYDPSTFWVDLGDDEIKDVFASCSFFFVSPPPLPLPQLMVRGAEEAAPLTAAAVHELRFTGQLDTSGTSKHFRRIELQGASAAATVNVLVSCDVPAPGERVAAAAAAAASSGSESSSPASRPSSPRRRRPDGSMRGFSSSSSSVIRGSAVVPGIAMTLFENGRAVLQATDSFDQPVRCDVDENGGAVDPTFVRDVSSIGFSIQARPSTVYEIEVQSQRRKEESNFLVAAWVGVDQKNGGKMSMKLCDATAETEVTHVHDGRMCISSLTNEYVL